MNWSVLILVGFWVGTLVPCYLFVTAYIGNIRFWVLLSMNLVLWSIMSWWNEKTRRAKEKDERK